MESKTASLEQLLPAFPALGDRAEAILRNTLNGDPHNVGPEGVFGLMLANLLAGMGLWTESQLRYLLQFSRPVFKHLADGRVDKRPVLVIADMRYASWPEFEETTYDLIRETPLAEGAAPASVLVLMVDLLTLIQRAFASDHEDSRG